MKKKIIISIGTRPEIIKTAILIKKLKGDNCLQPIVVSTGQHSSMLDEMFSFFKITPDYNLNLMKHDQSLTYLSVNILTNLEMIIKKEKPDLMIVQGDTTTAFFSALAAYYQKVPIAHIEAGLRTYDKYQPFPEEINRQFIDRISDFLFAPTKQNYQNLIDENIEKKKIYITGNTVIDALNSIKDKFKNGVRNNIVLITAHRRENFNEGIKNICKAIRRLAIENKNFKFIYPVHRNPNIQTPVKKYLSDLENVKLISPLPYMDFIFLMMRSSLVLTDSGGVQEEAVSLGIPTVVLRNLTEREEGLKSQILKLAGVEEEKIYQTASRLLKSNEKFSPDNIFGDGEATKRIIKVIKEKLLCPETK